MSLTLEDVKKVSRLSRLKFSDEGLVAMQQQLNGIVHWIDQLQQVDTNGVEIFSDQQEQQIPERQDVICDGNIVEAILANAPEKAHDMFAVPKVVE
ncbi:Asp-tRNA(Asn)/Glu-tRNA(Gln) amidotransferase subunit GatC [Candidatus Paracaedibacter symbiosus]|uniref:Asp-tRNA(Asn)/Glu-tRNA(Gln) amidotransferase subunit GatC n=1 Tax=Candidatus Paracaedibacter symbiosus TaxID=244582 RepID=UPI000509CDFC|nr:Asp-tRNA(Asn)/Glu-tRNA(Gln) amidotransferase subunit GatC [Candidatus Paracaedibacter symbiosus]